MVDYRVHAIVFRREDWWVVQCLQYDIAAQAKTLKDLYYELERTLVGYVAIAGVKNIAPFEHLSPAPQPYWKLFQEALFVLPVPEMPFRIPGGRRAPTPELRIAA